jgi:cytochrome d ubiquinol oxidase subunit II
MINTIGPVWDANEVWLLVAGGATFAAFPQWYATLFSGFYLALLAILVALIFRGVAFEFRGKRDNERWRGRWDRAIFWGSAVPALLWGVAFANILRGVPIDSTGEFIGTFFDLLGPYALLGGLTSLLLFSLHGAVFLTLKTTGDIAERARGAAGLLAWPAAAAVVAFLVWTYLGIADADVLTGLVALGAVAAAGVVAPLVRKREGWAFVATGAVIVLVTVTFFLNLYPRVLVSSIHPDFSLTIFNASSSPYTLKVMSVVALAFTPFVLGYQAWSYWIWRKRVTGPVTS